MLRRDPEAGAPPRSSRAGAPALWTSWRDVRDGTVVTVVEVKHWDRRIAVLPEGGQGYLRVSVEHLKGPPRGRALGMRRLDQWDFEENFEQIYDPHTGWERAA